MTDRLAWRTPAGVTPPREHVASTLVAASVASLLPWLPVSLFVIDPQRQTPIGSAGALLIAATVLLQAIGIAAAFIVTGTLRTMEDERIRRLRRNTGWLVFASAALWSAWLAFSLTNGGENDWMLLAIVTAALLVPLLMSRSRPRGHAFTLITASLAVPVATLILTTIERTPILIAPGTVFSLATAVSGLAALETHRRRIPHRSI